MLVDVPIEPQQCGFYVVFWLKKCLVAQRIWRHKTYFRARCNNNHVIHANAITLKCHFLVVQQMHDVASQTRCSEVLAEGLTRSLEANSTANSYGYEGGPGVPPDD